MKQNLRLASLNSDQRKASDLNTLTIDDVKHLVAQTGETKSNLGFKFGK